MQTQLERLARVLATLDDLVGRYDAAGRPVADPRAQERALSQGRAPRGGRARRRRAGGRGLRRAPSTCGRATRRGQRARAASTCAAPTTPKLVRLLLAQGRHRRRRRREEGALLPGGADLRRGARGPGERDRRVPARAVGRRRRSAALEARAPLHPPRRGGTTQGRLRQEGGAGHRRPTRRSRCSSCSARSTTASSTIPSARSRPTGDPGPRSRGLSTPRRRSIASTRAERWYDLLAILERRSSWRRPRRDGLAQVPHRPAVAREPEGPRPRRRGLPRGAGDGPGARADPRRARRPRPRQGRAGAGRRGARADLRERRRVGARDRGLRGDGGHSRGSGPPRRAALHRIAELEERRLSHQNAAFDAYGARAARRSEQRGHARAPRAARRRHRPLGRSSPSLYAAEIEKARRPAPGRSAAAPRPRLRGGDRPGRARPSPPTGASSRSSPTTGRRSSRSTGCTRTPSGGTSWPTSCGARSGSRRTDEDRRAAVPARRRSTSRRSSTCPRPSRPTTRS